MTVGAGYSAAMLQLHVQDSKSGKPLPTPADVVLKFTGKKWCDSAPPPPPCKFVCLVIAPRTEKFTGNGTMAPAFFEKSGDWNKARDGGRGREPNATELAQLMAEREGEQSVTALWGEAAPAEREKAYQDDTFTLAAEKAPKAITAKFKNADGSFKVKSIIDTRCARCHKKEGDDSKAEQYLLANYAQIAKYLNAPEAGSDKGAGWYRVQEPMGIEKLTQSTHAHLLSFAVLFSLTGLIFAFSSYPSSVRCLLGPLVVIAVFADVALWWLARTCDQWGPWFAYGIIGTGGAAGLGLTFQIILSLFNMYGVKGKFVVALLLLAGGGLGSFVFMNNIVPAITKPESIKAEEPPKDQVKEKPKDTANAGNGQVNPKVDQKVDPPKVPSEAERLLGFPKDLNGKPLAWDELPFNAADDGGMTPAFFKQEKVFRNRMNDAGIPQAEKDKLFAERDGERKALVAWIRMADTARKSAYDADKFDLPAELTGKPFTAEYLKDGKVRIKSIIDNRCVTCHIAGAKRDDTPFDTYDGLLKQINPPPPAPK
jgi:hypothetical protein